MKRKEFFYLFILVPCIFLLSGYASGQDTNPCKTGGQTSYFGVVVDDILCGYSVETYCEGILNGEKVRFEYSEATFKIAALGSEIDGGFQSIVCY